MAMNADGNSSAARPVWKRPKFLIATAVTVVLLIAASVTATVIAQGAAAEQAATEAAEQAAAKAVADKAASQSELEAAHEESIRRGREALVAYEARYTDSLDYGAPDARAELRTALDALSGVLARNDATTDELDVARGVANNAFKAVGSREDLEASKAKAAADAADAAARALDKTFTTLANVSEDDWSAIQSGESFCSNLTSSYSPDTILTTGWADGFTFSDIENAAVRIYCPQFVAPMELMLSGFQDGNHVVGDDIKAGAYRTAGPVSDCYWERNNGSGDTLDNDFVTSAHNGLTVRVNNGEGFTSEGCGLWVPVK